MMSLDVYLRRSYQCPHCGAKIPEHGDELHQQNITHNLAKMANEANLYGLLWRPEENGIDTASQLIEPLRKAIAEMKNDPPRFEKHNSPNGWGLYEHFLPWLEELLTACETNPGAVFKASR